MEVKNMAEQCQPCTCIPYDNICCCPPQDGITVVQPECQVLPDDSVVNNPCYNPECEGRCSFWSYKVITDCAQDTRGVSSIAIPVCETIPEGDIIIEEKIDGCGEFQEVGFELNADDPIYGEAPPGFKYLKIASEGRYDKGVCVLYRIKIGGSFPVTTQPISVKAANNPVITFDCDPEDCYLVPACPAVPQIFVNKTCTEVIEDNKPVLSYTIEVMNIGNTTIDNVQFDDQINFDGSNLAIASVEVEPETLDVDTSVSGVISVTGDLDTMEPGDLVEISIEVLIDSIANSGQYIVTNIATASGGGVESTDRCSLNIDAVRLSVAKCCTDSPAGVNTRIFRLSITNIGNSPATLVTVNDQMIVPAGVTIQFTDFGGCSAVYADDPSTSVPLNTDITNRTLLITCEDLNIPQGATLSEEITFRIVGTTAFVTPVEIVNTIQQVDFLNTEEQVLLGIDNVPTSARVTVIGNIECQNPC